MQQKGETFTFKPLVGEDLVMLNEWLNRPHVAARWDGPVSLEETRQKYLLHIDSASVFSYIACLTDEPIGFVQSYRAGDLETPSWPTKIEAGTIGIDYFLADSSRLGQGLGSKMVLQFCQMIFADASVQKLICDPSPDNAASIACLEKAGFIKIGLIDTADGPALAMELVKKQ
jgi:aminoglycoside 6'-N-acetyltransferase-1b/aminoglycoside 6'-N-acetyltransferase-2